MLSYVYEELQKFYLVLLKIKKSESSTPNNNGLFQHETYCNSLHCNFLVSSKGKFLVLISGILFLLLFENFQFEFLY